MAKSARSSSLKTNNQKLKKNVFGPVEKARALRLSAKLQEIAAQPKPVKEVEMEIVSEGLFTFQNFIYLDGWLFASGDAFEAEY